MKIEFGVQEYFNELKLMDAQYGQEEELYPWIYMLLQMAECRKGEQYKGVSIRDVHKGVKAIGDSELKKKLYSIGGFPDFAIFNKEATREEGGSLLGCVEIKKYEITELKNALITMKEKKERKTIEIVKEKGNQISLIINSKNILEELSCGEEELDKAILNGFEKEYNQIKQQQYNRYYYYTTELSEVEMENKRLEEIETEVKIKLNNEECPIKVTIRSECVEKINYESDLICEK